MTEPHAQIVVDERMLAAELQGDDARPRAPTWRSTRCGWVMTR